MEAEEARRVLEWARGNSAEAQQRVWRFLEGPLFWRAVPSLWTLDATWCAVAVTRRVRWRADEEAARAVAALAALPAPPAAARQLGLARARLLVAGFHPGGECDEALLEALPPLAPSLAAASRLAGPAWSLCCARPESRAAHEWLPLLLRLRPDLDLSPLGPSPALATVLGTSVTPETHLTFFAAILQHALSPPLALAVWAAGTDATRLALLERFCVLLAAGTPGAAAEVRRLGGPATALLRLLGALLRGLASGGLLDAEGEDRKEVKAAIAHLYDRLGPAQYGGVVCRQLNNPQLSAVELRSLWLCCRPVVDASLLVALLPRALSSPTLAEAAVVVARAAAGDGRAHVLQQSVTFLLDNGHAEALAQLCEAATARCVPALSVIAVRHRVRPIFAASVARLSLFSSALAPFAEAAELAVASRDAAALLQLASVDAQERALAVWVAVWPRVVSNGATRRFWQLAQRLLEALGPRFAPLVQGVLSALRSCSAEQLSPGLFTLGLLIQQFPEDSAWHGALEATCAHVGSAVSADSELLTVFFQVILQPLFYTPEAVLGSAVMLRGLLGAAMRAAQLPDPELHRALAQVTGLLVGERVGPGAGAWRAAAAVGWANPALATRLLCLACSTQHEACLEHIATQMAALCRIGATVAPELSRLNQAENAALGARLRAAEEEGLALLLRLCSDVEHGVAAREALLAHIA